MVDGPQQHKALYQFLVKMSHPDRAADEADRVRLTALMQRINTANDQRDIDALRRLVIEVLGGPGPQDKPWVTPPPGHQEQPAPPPKQQAPPRYEPPTQPSVIWCDHCGVRIDPDDHYCQECQYVSPAWEVGRLYFNRLYDPPSRNEYDHSGLLQIVAYCNVEFRQIFDSHLKEPTRHIQTFVKPREFVNPYGLWSFQEKCPDIFESIFQDLWNDGWEPTHPTSNAPEIFHRRKQA